MKMDYTKSVHRDSHRFFAVSLLLLQSLCALLAPQVFAAGLPTSSPVNPAFEEYLAKPEQRVAALSVSEQAVTNQFLFLTLRLKSGVVTLEKALVVSGTLKPQRDSTEADLLLVTLEQGGGGACWSLAIDDPSVQRQEYEDPQQPGALRSKRVQVDDIEFVVRAPLTVGARYIGVYRKEKGTQAATPGASAPAHKLLARIELPGDVTR